MSMQYCLSKHRSGNDSKCADLVNIRNNIISRIIFVENTDSCIYDGVRF